MLEGVCEGIKLLNSIPNTEIFIVTNQSGVALDEPRFAELTEARMHEVNRYILERLSEQGAHVRGYFACPFVDSKYANKVKGKGWKINPRYLCDNHPDLKPRVGMLEKCAESLNIHLRETSLFVIGDRKSDVELGLNGGGTGILVASEKTQELGDIDYVGQLQSSHGKKVHIARNFIEAGQYIFDIVHS